MPKKYPKIYPTFDYSLPVIFSYKVGVVKPNKPMYEKIDTNRFNSITYIDDNMPYLKTGVEEFGWNGIWFTPYSDYSEPVREIQNGNKHTFKIFLKCRRFF